MWIPFLPDHADSTQLRKNLKTIQTKQICGIQPSADCSTEFPDLTVVAKNFSGIRTSRLFDVLGCVCVCVPKTLIILALPWHITVYNLK